VQPVSPPITVAIVEDEKDVRDSLAFLFDHTAGYQCVAACPDAARALQELPPLAPNVILIDITSPVKFPVSTASPPCATPCPTRTW
jgi:DNA-binding NarL/FixJ family response regulator